MSAAAPPQLVDERCLARCTALAEALAECERSAKSRCKPEYSAWRTHCVTNSACNPSGKQRDPHKNERRCETLARRVAICDASIDGQAKRSATRDCESARAKFESLCSGVVMHEDDAVNSEAITTSYCEAAANRPSGPSTGTPTSPHPVFALAYAAMLLSGVACGGIAIVSAMQVGGSTRSSRTQQLMQARIYGQAGVVSTIAGMIGLNGYAPPGRN